MSVFLEAATDGVHGTVFLGLPELSISKEIPVTSLKKGQQKVVLPALNFTEKDEIKAWWPRGYGSQTLYTVKVQKIVK